MKTWIFSDIKVLVLVGVVGIFAFGSASSFASTTLTTGQYELPGIVSSSLPAFETPVRVSYLNNSSGSKITAVFNYMGGDSNLVFSSQTFGVQNTKYRLTAFFDSYNVFQSGTVQIRGKIPGLVSGHGIQTLMTANLTSFASNALGDLLGFNTDNIVCHPDINVFASCTTSESVYLALSKGIFEDGKKEGWEKFGKFTTTGVAITSIPVPAAVWLFGSGLLGLSAVARRKKMA
jgi:hypothetical protein